MRIHEIIRNILNKNEEKEYALLNFIQVHCRNSFFDLFFSFISTLTAAGFIWFVLSFFLLLSTKPENISLAFALLLALSLHIVISHYYIKNAIARTRPCAHKIEMNASIKKNDIKKQVQFPSQKISYSFPSGHVSSSFAAASLLYFYNSALFVPALPFVILVAFSRIYLYKHFPTDVLAGIFLGISFACLSYFLTQFIDFQFFLPF